MLIATRKRLIATEPRCQKAQSQLRSMSVLSVAYM